MFHTDPYSLSAVIFIIILAIFVYRDRDKFTRDGVFLLRKTQKGKSGLIALGERHPMLWKHIGNLGVIIGFVVSILMIITLVKITLESLSRPTPGAIGLLLPSLSATPSSGPGLILVPFWYWIIIIALLAFVHEGLHGVMAAREKVRLKSLGWGLLAVIPLAFVEPDEKVLRKKQHIQQLRVFAAGSLANFALAGVAMLLLFAFSGFYMQTGVSFTTYPTTEISALSIKSVNNTPFDGNVGRLLHGLAKTPNSSMLELASGSDIFYITKEMLERQISRGKEKIIVFENLPAAKGLPAGAAISSVNGRAIKNDTDLRQALLEAGPNKTIEIATANGTFTLVTAAEGDFAFRPDTTTHLLALAETSLPGFIDSYLSASRGGEENYRTIKADIAFWKYIRDAYTSLSTRAAGRLSILENKLAKQRHPGIIGISNVRTNLELRPSLSGYRYAIDFLEGLLWWLFLINAGVGAFNLLPVNILDGGRMWELVFMRLSKKHYKKMLKYSTMAMGALIIINLLIQVRLF